MNVSYQLPEPGSIPIDDQAQGYLAFITEHQLLDEALWRRFVSAYQTKADAADRGWRGEYWGKMMRGACLLYRCTKDEKLYAVLEQTVKDLLGSAEPDGHISTYSRANECSGWDLWCRKYVLTGMLHFYDICRDESLRSRILDSMQRHVDCIIDKVGDAPGKTPITQTSDFWLGVNSCSILEPVIDLFRRTKEQRFLDFAAYILSTGGCSGGDLVELALENKTPPHAYPENKAYETMSFFEGVLAYYEATGEQRLLTAVLNFAEQVANTEITIIGCAGCTHEQFDNAAVRQTEPSAKAMQETCVTVTWMRLCARLFLLTGEPAFADRVEQSALNALYGSVNLYAQETFDRRGKRKLSPLPFDSYSPLYMSRRGLDVGGLRFFDDGTFYGCCACIGAAGLGLYPLIKALQNKEARPFELRAHRLNKKIAFTYGPYVLARDEAKEDAKISRPVRPLLDGDRLCYELLPCCEGETVRLRLLTKDGSVLLTDYASCGKRWSESDALVTVWMPEEKQRRFSFHGFRRSR